MRAVIAEDSVLLREGVAGVLRAADFDVVGCCETADDLMLKVRSYSPDVAIVDIRLPPTHQDEGLQAALEIRTDHPSVGVLVLSQYVEVGLALKLFADTADGAGYLLKDRISDVPDFVAAVRRVATGGSAIDPIIVSTLVSRRRDDDPLSALTRRERDVLVLMFLAVLTTTALSQYGVVFSVPYGTLVVFVGIAILAGMLAAILPARRASRLNVLEALQYE